VREDRCEDSPALTRPGRWSWRSWWKGNSQKFISGMLNKSDENRSARTLFPFPASNQTQHLAALDKDAGSRITCPLPNLVVDQGFTRLLL
jgi:hypothetical protein